MKLVIVVEPQMLPIPESIAVLDDWGFVSVVDDSGVPLAHGDHMHLEGSQQDFQYWLSSRDVWSTKPGTPPMFQQFEQFHIGRAHEHQRSKG